MSATVIPFRRPPVTDERFGGCPQCGGSDGYFNVRSNHWFYCEAHKTAWNPASNIFSGWRDETEEQWASNKEKFRAFSVVQPIYPGDGGEAA